MNRKRILALALIFALTFTLAACGSGDKSAPASPSVSQPEDLDIEDGILALAGWSLSASTWSSPNGATIHLTATPVTHAASNSALFLARLEGEEVDRAVCQWENDAYTASLDLNAADGYCYYLVLSDGETTMEVPVNTPTEPFDISLIDLATSLKGSCSLSVEDFTAEDGVLTITSGSAQLAMPVLPGDGQVTCTGAMLELTSEGEILSSAPLTLPQQEDGAYTISLQDVRFGLPQLEDGVQLELQLTVQLSNSQMITAYGGSWLTEDGGFVLAVG